MKQVQNEIFQVVFDARCPDGMFYSSIPNEIFFLVWTKLGAGIGRPHFIKEGVTSDLKKFQLS